MDTETHPLHGECHDRRERSGESLLSRCDVSPVEGRRVQEVGGGGGSGEDAQQAGFMPPNYVLNTVKKAHFSLRAFIRILIRQRNINNIERLQGKEEGWV